MVAKQASISKRSSSVFGLLVPMVARQASMIAVQGVDIGAPVVDGRVVAVCGRVVVVDVGVVFFASTKNDDSLYATGAGWGR